jgi:hypothetical protein
LSFSSYRPQVPAGYGAQPQQGGFGGFPQQNNYVAQPTMNGGLYAPQQQQQQPMFPSGFSTQPQQQATFNGGFVNSNSNAFHF